MEQTTAMEFARHAYDFRDAAVGAEHPLGEREEYQLHASLPVACLLGTCIDLALRSFILAMDSSLTQFASPDSRHDLQSLFDEATRLGLVRLLRVDQYDARVLNQLSQLRSASPAEYLAINGELILEFRYLKKLTEDLLEVACAMAGYERRTYE